MATLQWKEQLIKNPASFRGLLFYVDTADLVFGRKTAIHEFPKRNQNFVEDMGGRTKEHSITGYFLGATYLEDKIEFIRLIDVNKGRGILVHPYYGKKTIVITSEVKISENTNEGGICKFSFTCMEEGVSDMPSLVPATAPGLLDAINAAIAAAVASFEKLFTFVNAAQSAIDRTSATINNATVAVANIKTSARKLKSFQNSLTGILDNINSLILQPKAIAQLYVDLFGADTSYEAIAQNLEFTEYDSVPDITEQVQALNAYLANAAVILACQSVAYLTFTDLQQTIDLKNIIGASIDTRMENAEPELYDALHSLRGALILDINSRSEGLPSVRTIQISALAPSIVLAYRLYEDVSFSEDIQNRNNLQHPGFIQSSTPIEVISRV